MPIRFTLRQIEYFVAVGEAGGVSKAAERLNVSPPSISAAIAQLEADMGLKLFVRRHAQGLSLTSGGRELFLRAQALLGSAEGLNTLAGALTEQVSGPLRFGCQSTFAPLIAPELCAAFRAEHPRVEIRLTEHDHASLVDDLRDGRLDIGLMYDLEMPSGVEFEPLVSLPAYVTLPAAHPLAEMTALTPAEIVSEPMVLLDLPVSAQYFLSAFKGLSRQPTIAARAQNMTMLRSLVANGFGLALANVRPRSALSPDGKELAFAPLKSGPRALNLGIASTDPEKKPKVAQAFAEFCRRRITRTLLPGMIVE